MQVTIDKKVDKNQLFMNGTFLKFCLIRDKVLYIDIAEGIYVSVL